MLCVATYNIQTADRGKNLTPVAEEIRRSGADIVGLQEVDRGTDRSFREYQAELLAEKTGLSYFGFFPAIPFQGGEYGIATLSRYPINEAQAVPLESGKGEARVLSRCEINTGRGVLTFFNTHLSLLSQTRAEEMDYLGQIITGKHCILTGDFNIASMEEYRPLESLGRISTARHPFNSFKGGGAIDNIFFSKDLILTRKEIRHSYSSDHEMLLAEFQF